LTKSASARKKPKTNRTDKPKGDVIDTNAFTTLQPGLQMRARRPMQPILPVSLVRKMKTKTALKGSPSKLLDEVRDTLLESIRLGQTFQDACAAAGISLPTFNIWRRYALAGKSEKWRNFFVELRAAESDAERRALKVIDDAANGGVQTVETKETYVVVDGQSVLKERTITKKNIKPNWGAAAWKLSHRFKQRWGNVLLPPVDPQTMAEQLNGTIQEIDDGIGTPEDLFETDTNGNDTP